MNDNQTMILSNRHVQNATVAALALLALFLAVEVAQGVKAYRYIGGGVPVSNTITVSGEGEVFAVPDIASFTFSIIEESKVAADAQGVATGKVDRALALLKEKGVEDRDVKTTGYNLYPLYEYTQKSCTQFSCPPGERILKGFEVNQTIAVKVRKTDSAGDILAGIGEIGVGNVSGLEFTIDDDESLKAEARESAIANAKERADALADDLGVKLVRIVSFSESGNMPPIFYAKAAMDGRGGMGGEAVQVPSGENKITSTVNITYEIR